MTSDSDIIIIETTQLKMFHYLVGVSNIWERELPDQQGVIKPRLSANINIFDLDSKESREQEVFSESIIALEGQNYRVVNVNDGTHTRPGSITLQKMS